jgi:hypothetical protein
MAKPKLPFAIAMKAQSPVVLLLYHLRLHRFVHTSDRASTRFKLISKVTPGPRLLGGLMQPEQNIAVRLLQSRQIVEVLLHLSDSLMKARGR